MKAEIISLDICGCEIESKVFEIPLVVEVEKYNTEMIIDGVTWNIEHEPMKQNRYILKIGGYVYLMRQSGELEIM